MSKRQMFSYLWAVSALSLNERHTSRPRVGEQQQCHTGWNGDQQAEWILGPKSLTYFFTNAKNLVTRLFPAPSSSKLGTLKQRGREANIHVTGSKGVHQHDVQADRIGKPSWHSHRDQEALGRPAQPSSKRKIAALHKQC